MNVKRNMLKEQEMDGKGEEENYHSKDAQAKGHNNGKDKIGANQNIKERAGEEKAGDINLTDRNVVLNFAEEGEED